MSNPNFPPQQTDLPFEAQGDGRVAMDPMAGIEAAQAAAAERERQDLVRQGTEAFVGSLENPDEAALTGMKDYMSKRPAGPEPTEEKKTDPNYNGIRHEEFDGPEELSA